MNGKIDGNTCIDIRIKKSLYRFYVPQVFLQVKELKNLISIHLLIFAMIKLRSVVKVSKLFSVLFCQVKEQKKKHLRSLAELHYDKAKKFFTVVDSPCELLRVLLERVAMCEFQLLSKFLTIPYSILYTVLILQQFNCVLCTPGSLHLLNCAPL